jgi:hypothetical protein
VEEIRGDHHFRHSRGAKLDHEKTALQRQIAVTDTRIDQLMYELEINVGIDTFVDRADN